MIKYALAQYITVAALLAAILMVGNSFALDMESYRKSGVVITVSPEWKPYTFVGYDGKPAGVLVGFWELWSEKTGIPVTFRMVTWAETIRMVAEGEADIQSGLYFNDQRNKILDYSMPFQQSEGVLVSRGDHGIPCGELFSMGPVAVLKAGHEEYYIRTRYPDTPVMSFDTTRQVINAVLSGAANGAVLEYYATLMFLRDMGAVNDVHICERVYNKDLHAAVRKGNVELLQVVERGLAMISPEEIDAINKLWFVAEKEDEWQAREYVGVALLLILTVLALRVGLREFFKRD